MKKYLLGLMAVAVLMACNTMTSAERAEQRMKVAQQIEQMLAEKHYTVDVKMMYPRGGRAENVTSNYSLEIKGDTLVSYLPYFGRAYNVPYGGGKGLNFSAPVSSYEMKKEKNGKTYIMMRADNGEDVIDYQLEIFDNGQTTIDVTAREREPISYSGEIIVK